MASSESELRPCKAEPNARMKSNAQAATAIHQAGRALRFNR
ncbi:hypothetical protein [Salaquimonas pukyongi]|nr:hypothetical protein [Salaquimonas pukyongi]